MESGKEGKIIGERIKAARRKVALTQRDLHELTGISITQISSYENGNRNIGLRSLKKIADATKTTIDDLYCGGSEYKQITSSTNIGKLIVNCVTALFENGVITVLCKDENKYVKTGLGYFYQIGFGEYVDILDNLVKKLTDFEANKGDYPNPEDFKKQIIEAASKKINDRSWRQKKKATEVTPKNKIEGEQKD